jgi:hypothetical protein
MKTPKQYEGTFADGWPSLYALIGPKPDFGENSSVAERNDESIIDAAIAFEKSSQHTKNGIFGRPSANELLMRAIKDHEVRLLKQREVDSPSADAYRNCLQLPTANVRMVKMLVHATYTGDTKSLDGDTHPFHDLLELLKLVDFLGMVAVKDDVLRAIATCNLDDHKEIREILQLSDTTFGELRAAFMQVQERVSPPQVSPLFLMRRRPI